PSKNGYTPAWQSHSRGITLARNLLSLRSTPLRRDTGILAAFETKRGAGDESEAHDDLGLRDRDAEDDAFAGQSGRARQRGRRDQRGRTRGSDEELRLF